MSRLRCLLPVLLLVASLPGAAAAPPTDLTQIDRGIAREPEYRATPRYALVVFGREAKHRSWLVVDGQDVAYIDRNGNRDLTDAEDRVEIDQEATDANRLAGSGAYTGFNIIPLGTVAGVNLTLQLWVRNESFVPTSSFEKYIDRIRAQHGYENASLMRTTDDGAAQNPVLLMRRPADAQISHLDGPLTFGLKWDGQQSLDTPPGLTVFDLHIGTPGLAAKGCEELTKVFSPLTVGEIPGERHPVALFEYFAAGGPERRQQIVKLKERCCGDTVYARFLVPENIDTTLPASVLVTFPAWIEREVHAARFTLPFHEGPLPRPWDVAGE